MQGYSSRVVLSSGKRWPRVTSSNVASIIQQCWTNRLICVLEVHDTTGYGEQSGAATLDEAVDYWISIKSVLDGQEAYVILNIGNEPIGNTSSAQWIAATKGAIQRMRSAGFQHQLMVDAPNWGQDWTMTMRDNAASVFASDSKANTIFSVHMYGVYNTAAKVQSYIQTFVDAKLPLVVGEFGFNHSDGDPDEATIMSTSKQLGIGYLGWSWSGNGGGVEYLDLVTNFDPARLTSWGDRLINGANGIRATSREASVFGSAATPTRVPPTATRVAATPT